MNHFFSLRPVAVLVAAIGVLTLSARASAEERPHKSAGQAQFVSPTDFVGSGKATHLGRYTEVGSVSFSPTDDPAVLRIDARSVYTAANGDRLCATFTGQLNGLTGAISATGTYVGGTGRFDDAYGSVTLSGQMLPNGTITVSVEGTIDY
jgi:hypothetical protein